MSQANTSQQSNLRGGINSSDGQSHGVDNGGSERPFTEVARAGLVEVKERARQATGAAREKAGAMLESCADYISDNPYRCVGIALGVGLVAGLILFRRGSSSSDSCD